MKLTIDFAFEGFKTIRKAPLAIPVWGGVILLGLAIGLAALVPAALPFFTMVASGRQTLDPSAMAGMMGGLFLSYFLMLACMIVSYSVVACAIYRVVLGEARTSFAYLKLGADEWRNILANFLFALVFVAIYMGLLLGGGIAGGVVGALLSMLNKDLMWVGIVLGILAAIGCLIWILMRLSLFSVHSFATKTIDLFGSWKMTRGYSWTLIGGYLVAYIVAVAVETVCMIPLMMVMLGFGFANQNRFIAMVNSGAPDVAQILTAIAPMIAVYVLYAGLLVIPLMLTIFFSAPAAAYRTLTGVAPAQVENVF